MSAPTLSDAEVLHLLDEANRQLEVYARLTQTSIRSISDPIVEQRFAWDAPIGLVIKGAGADGIVA